MYGQGNLNVCIIISFFAIFIAVVQCGEGKNEIFVENNEQTGVRVHQTFFNFPNLVLYCDIILEYFYMSGKCPSELKALNSELNISNDIGFIPSPERYASLGKEKIESIKKHYTAPETGVQKSSCLANAKMAQMCITGKSSSR